MLGSEVTSEDDDLSQLSEGHLEVLDLLLYHPAQFTQRVVETLGFLPGGGEHWRREVQLRLPHMTPGGSESLHVVSLGMFRRVRFPDFAVHDSNGTRLPLLTRRQHGHCMAMIMLRQYLDDHDWDRARGEKAFTQLYHELSTLVTDIKGVADITVPQVEARLEELMTALGKDGGSIDRSSRLLRRDANLLDSHTHYLCWVRGQPQEPLHLAATYTMADSVRLAGRPRKSAPDPEEDGFKFWRMRAWSRLNLQPVYYELRAPAHDHAGSYYLTVEAPADAHVSLLEWGHDRSFGGRPPPEMDSAFPTCHIHNGARSTLVGRAEEAATKARASTQEDPPKEQADGETVEKEGTTTSAGSDGAKPGTSTEVGGDDDRPSTALFERESIAGSRIHVFMKANPVDHAVLIAVACVNLVLAYLAQRGSLLPQIGEGHEQWLLVAPALVVAFIAQHRRGYYSEVTRPVRGLMWAYLAVNAGFAASVAFNVFGKDQFDDLASGAMVLVSLGLIGLMIASGSSYERFTAGSYNRRHCQGEPPTSSKVRGRQYLEVGLGYADRVVAAIVLTALIVVAVLLATNWGDGRQDEIAKAAGERAQTTECTLKGSLNLPRNANERQRPRALPLDLKLSCDR